MATMGFLQHAEKSAPVTPSGEAFFAFDSGKAITFEEAVHNTLVLGSSGVGKTSSVILPAVNALLKKGYAGLIIDIKGNFTEQTKILAEQYNRSADIVELGNAPSAMPINILESMEESEVFDFLRVLTLAPFSGVSQSLDWHVHGVRQAVDCLQLLRIMHTHNKEISINIGTLEQIILSGTLGSKLFTYFKENIYDAKNKEQKRFFERVEGDTFHIFKRKEKNPSQHYEEQVTWRLSGIRNVLTHIHDTPGILQNFAGPQSKSIQLDKLIFEENKIVILRFDVGSGLVGALLSRHLLESYYATIYKHGLTLEADKHVFIVGDECQDYIDQRWYPFLGQVEGVL